jgi:hypothetical protein
MEYTPVYRQTPFTCKIYYAGFILYRYRYLDVALYYIQLIFLDGHIESTNKVPSTFSRLRVSLQWKPVHFSLCQYILVHS